jgi:hypothetical protein
MQSRYVGHENIIAQVIITRWLMLLGVDTLAA